jgi:hypothetical protein
VFKNIETWYSGKRVLFRDKRFYLLVVTILVLLLNFWLGSRYPSLNSKAMMSGSLVLEDLLSFDAHASKLLNPQWWEAIWTTYVNWLYTNKQGMIFGLSFAVLLMSFIALIKPLLS